MLKLGRVSKETRGTAIELLKVEDTVFCLPGNVVIRMGSGCPGA